MNPLLLSILGTAGFPTPTQAALGMTPAPGLSQGVAQPAQQAMSGATAQPPLPIAGGAGATGLSQATPKSVQPTTPGTKPAQGNGEQMAAIGSLAALPLSLGALFANRPPTLMSGADEFEKEAANQRRIAIQQATNANPNMNQALAQRNAAQAAMQQSQSIADQAARMRVEEENRRRMMEQQAKQQRIQGVTSALGQMVSTGLSAASFMSDERIKTNVQPAGPQVDQMLQSLSPQQFDVPAAGQQARTGVMAQDLLQSPMGARMVQQTPNGTLAVDTNAAAEGALAATARLDERMRAFEQELARRASGSISQMAQQDLASRTNAAPQATAPGMAPQAASPTPATPPTAAPQSAPGQPPGSPQAIPDQVEAALRRQFGLFSDPNFSPPSGTPAPSAVPTPAGPTGTPNRPQDIVTGTNPLRTDWQPPPTRTANQDTPTQRYIDTLGRQDQSITPTPDFMREGLMGTTEAARNAPWVQKVLDWTPIHRIQLSGDPAASQDSLRIMRTAMASSPTFRDAVLKFDSSNGAPFNLRSVSGSRNVDVGGSGTTYPNRPNRNEQTIDIGDFGRLPSILDAHWRSSDVPGANREAMMVHELTEGMIAAQFATGNPEDRRQGWKLYAEAHPSAISAENAFNAYLGSRSQRTTEALHPGEGLSRQEVEQQRARGNEAVTHRGAGAGPNANEVRMRYRDGDLILQFTGDNQLVGVRRVPAGQPIPNVGR